MATLGAPVAQDIADEVDGENVLIVTHGDAVNSSVTRLMPWTIVYPVLHTGYTVAHRDQHPGSPPALPLPSLTHSCETCRPVVLVEKIRQLIVVNTILAFTQTKD